MKFILYLYWICVLRAISVDGDDNNASLELMIHNYKNMARVNLYDCISRNGCIAPVDNRKWTGLLTFSDDYKIKLLSYVNELYQKEKNPDEMDNDMANNICKEVKYVQDDCVEKIKKCFEKFRENLVKKRSVTLTDHAYQKFAKSCKFINKNAKKFCLKSKTPAAED